jgi:hypothetical protein
MISRLHQTINPLRNLIEKRRSSEKLAWIIREFFPSKWMEKEM